MHPSTLAVLSSPGGWFKIMFTCQEGNPSCPDVAKSLQLATGFVENALLLERTITVDAKYLPHVKGKSWGWMQVMAIGEPCSDLIAYAGGEYFVPQALQRQLGVGEDLDDVDLEININPEPSYYFPKDYGRPQEPTEPAILDVVAHELLHGMGLKSFLGKEADNAELTPAISRVGRRGPNMKLQFSVGSFDRFLYTDTGLDLPDLIGELNLINEAPFRPEGIELTGSQLAILSIVHAAATRERGLYFLTRTGKRVYLETSASPIQRGTSISHLSHSGSDDALMTKQMVDGQGVHLRAHRRDWLTSPLGPLTLEILATMGYALNPAPAFERSLGGFVASIKNY